MKTAKGFSHLRVLYLDLINTSTNLKPLYALEFSLIIVSFVSLWFFFVGVGLVCLFRLFGFEVLLLRKSIIRQ